MGKDRLSRWVIVMYDSQGSYSRSWYSLLKCHLPTFLEIEDYSFLTKCVSWQFYLHKTTTRQSLATFLMNYFSTFHSVATINLTFCTDFATCASGKVVNYKQHESKLEELSYFQILTEYKVILSKRKPWKNPEKDPTLHCGQSKRKELKK